MSMRVMSAGDGHRYLLRSVAAGDGDRSLGTPLTRYYEAKGTPPGTWTGSGVQGLGRGSLRPGDTVTEEQLTALLGLGCDPVTGEPLGRAWPVYRAVGERIDERVAALPTWLPAGERAEEITRIENEEHAKKQRRAVAGFDHTFSVPKSVSALWAVADAGTQALIVQAHHAAIGDVLDRFEKDVAMTRVGVDTGAGAVAQVEVRGAVAVAYDHYDSRAGDAQLHTHVVVANKVQGAHDGRWRTLDGRPVHAAVVALSELYNALLADHLSRDLGLGWEWRSRGRDRNPAFELAAVPEELVAEFSTRSHAIEEEKDRLIAAYVARHGRQPTARTVIRLRAEATLSTRPEKTVRTLAELTESWRGRAGRILGEDALSWAGRVAASGGRIPLLRADDIPLEAVEAIAEAVVATVGSKRASWRRWNLHAEASRQLMDARFASTADREAATGLIVDAALRGSLKLTPPELGVSPIHFQRTDGSSVFRPKGGALYSSAQVLAAEDRILALAHTLTGPLLPVERTDAAAATPMPGGHRLSADQAAAVAQIGVSGRVVDLLVGPAGTGKTTALAGLRRAWELEHGPGSVIGLAPSADAAEVLAGDLGIATENTAKWAHEHAEGRWDFTPGQLVIVDESSLSGTFLLDELTGHAAAAGAKVVLVGDWAQLGAIDAGGMFGLLAREIDPAPELVDVRRFRAEWEKTASLALRLGRQKALDDYLGHGRLSGGDTEEMLDAAYAGWRKDTAEGQDSVMIADTVDAVRQLNLRARLDRIIDGTVHATREAQLHDGTQAATGDLVVTRKNDRRLRAGTRWVKNGDRWQVAAVAADGTVTVRRAGPHPGAVVVLPAWYAAEHLELAYALTGHRAQGSTVDTAHALVLSSSMTREVFYVLMTRGRLSNRAYVALDQAQLEDHQRLPDEDVTVTSVLTGVLSHEGADKSAHEMIAAEHEQWSGIRQLLGEYETIARHAQQHRWLTLLARSGLTAGELDRLAGEDSLGALIAELRRAEADGHRLATLLPSLILARPLNDADDIGAVLHYRVTRATAVPGTTRPRKARLIAGLFARADGTMTAEMRAALRDRETLIEARATGLAEKALADGAPWIGRLDPPPAGSATITVWLTQARIVAAYRDRYAVDDDLPLGPDPEQPRQRIDHARAAAALARARQLTAGIPSDRPPAPRRAPAGPTR